MPGPLSKALENACPCVLSRRKWHVVLAALFFLSSAPLAGAQEKPRTSGALKDAEKAIAGAEALASTGPATGKDFADFHKREEKRKSLLPRLKKADADLTKHLEKNSTDVAALFLQVRLDMVSRLITPVVISGGEVQTQEVPTPERDPQKTLDRIIELDPSKAEAYFLKARLYATRTMTIEGPKHQMGKAVQYARMAVERAPSNELYRRSLIFFLASSGDRAGAREAAATLGDPGNPLQRLIVDSLAVPAPEGGVEDPECANGWGEMLLADLDLPALRTQCYLLFKRSEEIEAFYARHWKGLKFHSRTGGPVAEIVVTILGGVPLEGKQDLFLREALFDWDGEKLAWLPEETLKERPEEKVPGLWLLVIEIVNPTDPLRKFYHVPESSKVVCQVLVMNLRPVKTLK